MALMTTPQPPDQRQRQPSGRRTVGLGRKQETDPTRIGRMRKLRYGEREAGVASGARQQRQLTP